MSKLTDFIKLGGGSLRLLDRQTFTSSGTWTKPADGSGTEAVGDNRLLIIKAIGAGGSGAASDDTFAQCYGGVGGVMTLQTFDIDEVGASVSVTIGAGGAAVANSGAAIAGNDGGDTTFGSHVTAQGGPGGFVHDTDNTSRMPYIHNWLSGFIAGCGASAGFGVGCPYTNPCALFEGGGQGGAAATAGGDYGAGGGGYNNVTTGNGNSGAGADGYLVAEIWGELT